MRLVVGGGHGQLVAAVVLDRIGMPLDPYEPHVVAPVYAQETHPQVGILLAGEPFLLPAELPAFRHGVHDVFRVGIDRDVRPLELERFERRADGRQLHAVVGRQAESLRKLLAVRARKQHRAVTARSGIPQGRAVGVYGDLCHAGLFQRRQLLPDGRDFRFCVRLLGALVHDHLFGRRLHEALVRELLHHRGEVQIVGIVNTF